MNGTKVNYDKFNGRAYITIICCKCKAEFNSDTFGLDGVWIKKKPYCGDCKPENEDSWK